MSALVIIGLGTGLYFLVPPLKASAQNKQCYDNLKGLGLAMGQYTRDYDEKYPLAARWSDNLKPYTSWRRASDVAPFFECPTTQRQYALNNSVSGISLSLLTKPEKLALFYEPSRPIEADDGASWLAKGVHKGGSNVCFADGHVKLLKSKPSFWMSGLNAPRSHSNVATQSSASPFKSAKSFSR